MPDTEPNVQLDERFSSPGATARPWADVVAAMEAAEIFWLSTTRRDGRPHVTPLPAMWRDGALHFCTGPEEQKARNLAAEPRCILTTGTDRYLSGLDIVVEGTAERVTDEATLEALAAMWRDKLDWPFEVVDGAFHHPTPDAGQTDQRQGSAHVFAVRPTKILAFGKGEPFTQTRYRFPSRPS
jgi:general stress protein 26